MTIISYLQYTPHYTCTTCVLIVLGLGKNIKSHQNFKNTNIIPDSATTAASADNVYLNQKVSATVSCDCRSPPPVIVENRPQTRVTELCLVEFGVQRSLPVYIRNDR